VAAFRAKRHEADPFFGWVVETYGRQSLPRRLTAPALGPTAPGQRHTR